MMRSSQGAGEVGKATQLRRSRGEPGRKGDTSQGRGKASKAVQQGLGKARWCGQAGRQGNAVDGPGNANEAVQSWQAGWC